MTVDYRPRLLDACSGVGDAVAYILEHGHEYDVIHMSWPCQRYTSLTRGTNRGREYPDLIASGRAAAMTTGRPWVIENVAGAPIRRDLMLCGEMFGLDVIRHRFFEFSPDVLPPRIAHCGHRGRVAGWRHGERFDGPYLAVYGEGGGKGTVAEWQAAMGIDWTDNRRSIAESIPPAYTEFIGAALIDYVRAGAVIA
jgi:DNA (cytosine-5)-methyltransferase 1